MSRITEEVARRLGRNAIERFARLGYGARGFVYVVVGVLAFLAAIGSGGKTGDTKGALRALLEGPLGAWVVGLIALGLLGFAAWRVVEGLTDADGRGEDPKGLAVRAAHLVSGVIYTGLAASAASLSLGLGTDGDDGVRDWTAWLLARPFGQSLVAAVGLAVAGGGIGFLVKAAGDSVTDRLDLDARACAWAMPVGRFGYAARGIAFLIIGGFLVAAAWYQASSEAKGLGGAFSALRAQPFGPWLLGVVAAGHVAFGAFGLIQARYRRIDAPDIDETDDALAAAAKRLT